MSHLKGKKRAALRSIIFLSAIILTFTVADLFNEERFFSESENRILAEKPTLSKEALLSGKYMEDYESYLNDQFVSRDIWIRLKTGMDMLMQKKLINGVYLAADDYLIEQHTEAEFKEELLEKRVGQLKKLVKKFPGTKVMLVPTADNILSEKLPSFAPYYDDKLLLGRVTEAVGEEHVINVYDILKAHADEEIYYRTDHHWTSLGAMYGYRAWVLENGKDDAIRYQKDDLLTVTENFKGTLQAKLNMPVESEEIKIFPQTLEKPVSITYDFVKKSDSFYEESYLETKDKYSYFIDGNHGFTEIETEADNGRELFIIKDSYANTFIPLIAHHYSKVYVLDLRYFNGSLFPFMEQYDKGDMEVLVLYNCAHFMSDFQYY